ncbi:MAG: alpha/beta hydrolase [Clostridiales bacterium]|nr:alpha/beta hydrolase [Clostridiales bacterium]
MPIEIWIILAVIILILAIIVGVSYYCFRRLFYSKDRTPLKDDEYEIPDGKEYQAIKDDIIAWIKWKRSLPQEDIEIKSHDGLTLRGKYFEYEKGAPVEILFHGYRGNAERDVSGGIERCFKVGRNVILVDHRASGASDGNVITFGIKERLDCLKWIEYAVERFGKDTKIVIGGMSMGAATVMMATAEDLPKNVAYAIADCGYTSPKEIISKVMREMGYPDKIFYPLAKLGAKLFGKFDLDETSPLQAMENAKIPVIFLHGTGDDFVPYNMSERLYERCKAKKSLVLIPNAEHGLAYPRDMDGYVSAVKDFQKDLL